MPNIYIYVSFKIALTYRNSTYLKPKYIVCGMITFLELSATSETLESDESNRQQNEFNCITMNSTDTC